MTKSLTRGIRYNSAPFHFRLRFYVDSHGFWCSLRVLYFSIPEGLWGHVSEWNAVLVSSLDKAIGSTYLSTKARADCSHPAHSCSASSAVFQTFYSLLI